MWHVFSTSTRAQLCVCVHPWTKGNFHRFNYHSFHHGSTSRGMERTCEAPSNEAPHMILGYRQGRLPTYLRRDNTPLFLAVF